MNANRISANLDRNCGYEKLSEMEVPLLNVLDVSVDGWVREGSLTWNIHKIPVPNHINPKELGSKGIL